MQQLLNSVTGQEKCCRHQACDCCSGVISTVTPQQINVQGNVITQNSEKAQKTDPFSRCIDITKFKYKYYFVAVFLQMSQKIHACITCAASRGGGGDFEHTTMSWWPHKCSLKSAPRKLYLTVESNQRCPISVENVSPQYPVLFTTPGLIPEICCCSKIFSCIPQIAPQQGLAVVISNPFMFSHSVLPLLSFCCHLLQDKAAWISQHEIG